MERAPVPEHRVARRGTPVSSASWERVAPLAPLRLSGGHGRPIQDTVVRVAQDAEALHVRFDCEDRDAWATRTERDAALWEEEVVELFLAPGSRDPARYFEFEVNPLGALFDAAVHCPEGRRETMRVDARWDCPGLRWGAAVEPSGARWTAWLAVPWAAVSGASRVPDVWRANFYRIDRPPGAPAEFSAWSPTWADPPDFHRPACFGLLRL